MKRITLQHLVRREIDILNKRIDRKILAGKSYRREAARHRALVAQYRRIQARKGIYISTASLLPA